MASRFGSTWNAEIQRKRRRMIPPPFLLSPDHLLVVLVIRIVYAAFAPLFLLVPLVIVLWCGHSKGTHWRHQRSRQKQRSDIFVSILHSYPPSPTRMMPGAPRLETNR